MVNRILIYVIINISSLLVTQCTMQCQIQNEMTNCIYDVVCELYAGAAANPTCNYEPYVKFIVQKSTVDTLGANFFGSTNFDSRVREIHAISNKWNKITESAFKYYPKTIKMDLSNNDIMSIKNLAFRGLIALQALNLSRNSISDLQSSSLITLENKDSVIEELDLSHNNIEKIPYDIFRYMLNVKHMFLEYNKLATLPDDIFTNLRNLTVLQLHHNYLTSLNMTLINLKSLKYLDVSFNNIKKLSGYELNRLSTLVSVNFTSNAIETIESNCFNQAFQLESVDLRNNKIKSVIDNVLFINNIILKYLNFEHNCITKIQDDAFKHNIINDLILTNNNITGIITNGTFSGLKNIENLNLCNQSVITIDEGAFIEMDRLQTLNFSRNLINNIANKSFGELNSLFILDLSHNRIDNIHFLNNCLVNLTELYLGNNLLTELKSHAFKNQTQLKMLDISMNRIKIIYSYFAPLNNLQYLKMSGNSLIGTIKSDTFSPAKYLRYLDFSNFYITRVESMAFVNMSVLARLNLSNNIIDEIDPQSFIGVNNLYSLDISHNTLKNFEVKEPLPNLRAIYLNYNKLTSLPKVNMSGLLYTDLSYNNIKNLSGNIFESTRNLKTLHLSNNKLKSINSSSMNSLSELTDLGLSGNELTNIDLSYFKQLISLDISRNEINFINSSILNDLEYLQYLDISANNITKLPPGTFQNIKILKFLNVSSNHISNLRYGSFKGLHRTEALDLSKNEIMDIDVDVFHECLELRKLIIDYNKIKSLDIDRLLIVTPKLNFLSIGGNPVSCKEIARDIRNINRTLAFHPVEITSSEKIYHEDNVYGIQCGDVSNNSTDVDNNKPTNQEIGSYSTYMIVIVCFLVVLLVLVLGVFMFSYYKDKFHSIMYTTESRLQMSRSLELNGSDFQSDLIG